MRGIKFYGWGFLRNDGTPSSVVETEKESADDLLLKLDERLPDGPYRLIELFYQEQS